jgi:hypothetical protein
MTEELHRAVGRMEGKIDGLAGKVDDIADLLATRDAHEKDIDKRVAAVEKKQAWYSGAAAAVGAIVAVLTKH